MTYNAPTNVIAMPLTVMIGLPLTICFATLAVAAIICFIAAVVLRLKKCSWQYPAWLLGGITALSFLLGVASYACCFMNFWCSQYMNDVMNLSGAGSRYMYGQHMDAYACLATGSSIAVVTCVLRLLLGPSRPTTSSPTPTH